MNDDTRREMEAEPWLAFWIEDGDEDLEDARVRFAVAQKIAVRELRAADETIELRVVLRGLLTTCLIHESESEP